MTLPYYDYCSWQSLNEGTKHRYERQLLERFGLDLNDTKGIYVDGGQVVGAVRYLLNEDGRKYAVGHDAAVELVGRDS